MGAVEENKGGREMTYAIELHIDMEEVDGKMEIVKAKSKHRGLMFWHKITIETVRNLICNKGE